MLSKQSVYVLMQMKKLKITLDRDQFERMKTYAMSKRVDKGTPGEERIRVVGEIQCGVS